MVVKILRRKDADALPYWQSFYYKGKGRVTVAQILDTLNETDDLFDTENKPAPRIRWECSCMQKMCGACAMLIDGTPALACNTFIEAEKKKTLTLAPLSKFPCVCDLVVDRSIIAEHMKAAELWIGDRAEPSQELTGRQYEISRCLKCGICLEVCANYHRGEKFFGAVTANESWLVCSETADETHKKAVRKAYRAHFESGCSKSLACVSNCPMHIDTLAQMAEMNRGKIKK